MTKIEAIKLFFGDVTMTELKALSKTERDELATLAADELGQDLES